jgi:Exportin-T
MTTLEHFARDNTDLPTAKLAFAVLTKMVTTWGGPDIVKSNNENTAPQPELPGFDRYMMERFSPLSWALPSSNGFNPKDAQARQVLLEVATLKKAIYLKTGRAYINWLSGGELRNTGMDEAAISRFIQALREQDMKAFKNFFAVSFEVISLVVSVGSLYLELCLQSQPVIQMCLFAFALYPHEDQHSAESAPAAFAGFALQKRRRERLRPDMKWHEYGKMWNEGST